MRAIPTLFDGDRIRSLDGWTDYIITSARSYGDAYAVEIITDEDGNEQQGEEILLSTNELRGYEVTERNLSGILDYLNDQTDLLAGKAPEAFDILCEDAGIEAESFEDDTTYDIDYDALLEALNKHYEKKFRKFHVGLSNSDCAFDEKGGFKSVQEALEWAVGRGGKYVIMIDDKINWWSIAYDDFTETFQWWDGWEWKKVTVDDIVKMF